ncbi:MAG: GatB/YqeY domain-containing protein [Anaerolineales bacterium]|nr:GatB/YqeY domain-containing protein [Anaerolineales bacterium]
MDTKTQLNNAMKNAMRAKDEVAKRTLRMVRAAIQQAEIDRREELNETAVLAILQKEVKSRMEAIAEAKQANRPALAADSQAEIAVLEKFLPEAMSVEDLRALAQEVVAEVGANSPAEMGKVMKVLIPRVAGRASGGEISKIVRELLQS